MGNYGSATFLAFVDKKHLLRNEIDGFYLVFVSAGEFLKLSNTFFCNA